MKPKLVFPLNILLTGMALASLANANYTAGQIINQDGTISSDSGNLVVRYDNTGDPIAHGAVELSGEAGSNGTTILLGNVDIYGESQANNMGYGIYMDASSQNAKVIIRTVTDSDQILIASSQARGIRMDSTSSELTLDASSSSETIRITSGHTGIETWGKIDIIGNVAVNAGGSRGIYAAGLAGAGGQITVSGTTEVVMQNQSSDTFALRANNSAQLVLTGNVSVRTNQIGIFSDNGSITLLSSLDMTAGSAETAIRSHGGNVQLSGGRISNTNGRAMYSTAGGLITDVNNQYHRYIITGNIDTNGSNSTIDLHLGDKSLLTGATLMSSPTTQTIDLSFQHSSIWNVTEISTLTNLTVDGNSTLAFNLIGENTFTNINAVSVALSCGAALQLAGFNSGDFTMVFDINLFNATQFTDAGAILITEDKYILDYTANGDGTYTINGITDIQIPEPATATLGLLALASLFVRRKKQ